MKRLVKSNTILSAIKYKSNDPRLPIIKAMEHVLGIEFRGNKPDWQNPQYSKKYDCEVDYTISSKSGYNGKRRYEFSLSRILGLEDLQDDIVRDMKDYILDNFGDTLNVSTYGGLPPVDKHYKLACDEYGINEGEASKRKDQSKKLNEVSTRIYDKVDSILRKEGYNVTSFKSYSNYVCIFVKVKILDESVEQDADNIRYILQEEGFHVKSVDIQYGRVMYPSTWVDHLIRVNVYYD